MKCRLFTAIIAILIASNILKGQNGIDETSYGSAPVQGDSLVIERKNGLKIRLIWPYMKNIKKHVEWEQLLEDFQTDLAKVIEDIPEYSFYSITYFQKQNLIVDEIKGRETYTVNENDGMDYVKSNICLLHGNKIRLSIEFNDKKELLDASIKTELEAAIAVIKNKFYISMITPERHYYSVTSASKIPSPKVNFNFFIPLGFRLGLLKNKPYVELRPGIGLSKNKQYFVNLNYSFLTQFNEITDRTEIDNYVIFTTGTIGAGLGSEIAVKVKNGIKGNENIYAKFGLNYRTRSGIQFGAEYFYRYKNGEGGSNNIFVFNVGIGF